MDDKTLEYLTLSDSMRMYIRDIEAQRDELLRVLQEAQLITAYAASEMTHADRMTKRAISTDLKVRAAIAKAKGE